MDERKTNSKVVLTEQEMMRLGLWLVKGKYDFSKKLGRDAYSILEKLFVGEKRPLARSQLDRLTEVIPALIWLLKFEETYWRLDPLDAAHIFISRMSHFRSRVKLVNEVWEKGLPPLAMRWYPCYKWLECNATEDDWSSVERIRNLVMHRNKKYANIFYNYHHRYTTAITDGQLQYELDDDDDETVV